MLLLSESFLNNGKKNSMKTLFLLCLLSSFFLHTPQTMYCMLDLPDQDEPILLIDPKDKSKIYLKDPITYEVFEFTPEMELKLDYETTRARHQKCQNGCVKAGIACTSIATCCAAIAVIILASKLFFSW